MAGALARGLGQPVAVFDVDRSRAEALAEAVGGQVLDSNIAVAEASDAIVLCHKPPQLEEVAAEVGDHARAVISILGGTPVAAVEAAYPGRPVYRFMPSIPLEVGRGDCPERLILGARVCFAERIRLPSFRPHGRFTALKTTRH